MGPTLQEHAPAPPRTIVHLFGGPYVTVDGERRRVPEGSKRLLAFVALRRGRVERLLAAGSLWPFVDDDRASGNLRSALWRLRRADIDVMVTDRWSLSLHPHVETDVALLTAWANRVVRSTPAADDLMLDRLPADALDLLPGWYDDWAIIEREQMRQRLLHAIEALSRHLMSEARYADAVDIALTAVAAEPLRESAQRALLEAQLAQGNWVEARRTYSNFASLTRSELGLEPSRQLAALVASGPPAAPQGVRSPRQA